jgi:hypothetical protein
MPRPDGRSDAAAELFRLVAVRAPSPASGTPRTIVLEDQTTTTTASTVEMRLKPVGDAPPNGGDDQQIQSLNDHGAQNPLPLGDFDRYMLQHDDQASPTDIRNWVRQVTGQQIQDLVASTGFKTLRHNLHVSLVAALKPPARNVLIYTGDQQQTLESLLRGVRLVGLIQTLVAPDVLQTGQAVQSYLQYSIVVLPNSFPRPANNLARPPAVADLKIVRLGPAHYEPGAIAHVENVMGREKRERTHRLLEQFETTETLQTEQTTEREQELGTNSQVQMLQETSRALADSTSLETGVSVSASYGPTVSVDADARVARYSSREETSRAASTFASQTITKARERVVERVVETRTTRHLLETEETNLHGFDNTGHAESITGVYRWVDAVHDAWMDNYGKRLMLEFLIPEPAAFLRWAADHAAESTDVGPEPPRPKVPGTTTDLSPERITDANYLILAGLYGASDVPEAPAGTVQLSLAWKGESDNQDLLLFADSKSMVVPKGYQATSWRAHCTTWGAGSPDGEVWMVSVGSQAGIEIDNTHNLRKVVSGTFTADQDSTIPVVMLGRGLINLSAAVLVSCSLTPAGRAKWQLEVYDAIMRAWRQQVDDWEVRKARAEAQALGAGDGVIDSASNPDENRAVERRELRRSVIHLLLGGSPDTGVFAGDAVVYNPPNPPALDLNVAAAERDTLTFLEQSFEWPNMTWVHYPYYWARRDRWADDCRRSGADPLWAAFLSAGATRVVAPVRPGFEAAMALYLSTGIIWNGGQVPTIGDSAYLGIAEEIAEALGTGTVPMETIALAPVRLPTSLVWLQPTASLNPA